MKQQRLRDNWIAFLKSKRKNILSSQILYLAKITSKNEDKIKIFSDKQKFVKFIVRIHALQKKMLKDGIQDEGNDIK